MAVRRLAVDADLRRREGAEVRAAVLAVHDGPAWRSQLESLYDQARSLPAADVDDLAESPTDDRYGAMLSAPPPRPLPAPTLESLMRPLGDLFDSPMRSDLHAALCRDEGPSLRVRVAPSWHEHEGWTSHLLELCSPHPRLSVSLPFLPATGSTASGRRPPSSPCSTGADSPRRTAGTSAWTASVRQDGPEMAGDLPFTDEALEWLEELLASPLWEVPRRGPVRGGSSSPADRL